MKTEVDLEYMYVKVMCRQSKITKAACVVEKWKLFDICEFICLLSFVMVN